MKYMLDNNICEGVKINIMRQKPAGLGGWSAYACRSVNFGLATIPFAELLAVCGGSDLGRCADAQAL